MDGICTSEISTNLAERRRRLDLVPIRVIPLENPCDGAGSAKHGLVCWLTLDNGMTDVDGRWRRRNGVEDDDVVVEKMLAETRRRRRSLQPSGSR